MLPPVPRRTAPGHGARRYRGHCVHARECAGRVAGPAHAACICGGHSMVAGFFALAAWRAFPARCVLADAPASLFATALRVAPGQRTRRDAQAFTCARTSAHFVGLGGCYRAAIQGVASLEPRGRQSRGSDGFRPIVWHVGACFCCNGDHGPGLAGAVSLEHFLVCWAALRCLRNHRSATSIPKRQVAGLDTGFSKPHTYASGLEEARHSCLA